MQTEPVEHRVPVSLGRVRVLVEGVVGPIRVRVLALPLPLKSIEPVLVLAVPRVRELAPVRVAVAPCKAAVVVMLLPVEIVPKPLAMEPAVRAPVPVMLLNVPAWRLLLVINPSTKAEPLYCRTDPVAGEPEIVRVLPCRLAIVGLG